jgi:hypothetical protein
MDGDDAQGEGLCIMVKRVYRLRWSRQVLSSGIWLDLSVWEDVFSLEKVAGVGRLDLGIASLPM